MLGAHRSGEAERRDTHPGKPLSGPEQFQARVQQIGEAAPWVSAAPYFARNIAELLKPHGGDEQ